MKPRCSKDFNQVAKARLISRSVIGNQQDFNSGANASQNRADASKYTSNTIKTKDDKVSRFKNQDIYSKLGTDRRTAIQNLMRKKSLGPVRTLDGNASELKLPRFAGSSQVQSTTQSEANFNSNEDSVLKSYLNQAQVPRLRLN
jgi:glycerol-3-phosphate O-acyltransferase